MTQHPRPGAERGDFFSRMRRVFSNPFAWMTRSTRPPQKYHPGEHLHGLDEHDLDPGDPGFRGAGAKEMPRTRSPEPPAT